MCVISEKEEFKESCIEYLIDISNEVREISNYLNSMKKSIDLCAIDYDSDEWMEYEEILYDIEYCEKELEVIKDYYDNYDYYWDMI